MKADAEAKKKKTAKRKAKTEDPASSSSAPADPSASSCGPADPAFELAAEGWDVADVPVGKQTDVITEKMVGDVPKRSGGMCG